MPERPLTDKEQRVVDAFEAARPGLGELVEKNIQNNEKTGLADSIAELPDGDLKAIEGTANNSFMYRRIGG